LAQDNNEHRGLMGSTIFVRNDNIEQALRKFKKKIQANGLLLDIRAKEFYEKPTSVRKRKKAQAKARWRKQLQSQQLPKKLY
jgi:small subunit ribosomal protein S21